MGKFAESAKSSTTFSFITEGRNKVKTDDIIARFPHGITINGFDLIPTTDKKGESIVLPAIAFAEDPSVFFFGGAVLNKICSEWLTGYESCEEASADLKAEGGVKVVLRKTSTKSGNTVTDITVID